MIPAAPNFRLILKKAVVRARAIVGKGVCSYSGLQEGMLDLYMFKAALQEQITL